MWHIHPHDLDKCARWVASVPTQQCSWFSGAVRSVGSNAQMQCSYREAHVPAWLARRRAANTVESWTATGRFFRRRRRSAGRCWSMTRPWVESGPTSTPASTHTQHSYTRLVTNVSFMHDCQMMIMMMMMMRGFVERVINSPQTRCCCRLAKQVGLQMSSERQRGESCSSQSGW